jgi:hypothetical protein
VRTTASITLTTYGDLIIHTRGKQHDATGTEFCIPDNAYADDSNTYYCSDLLREGRRKDQGAWNTSPAPASTCTSAPGTRGTGKKPKTECLFFPAPPAAYTDPIEA